MSNKIRVSRGRTLTRDYQAERMDVGLEVEFEEFLTKEQMEEHIANLTEFLEKQLDSHLGESGL